MSACEEIEYHDWKIDNNMSNKERYEKSVSAYYLNEWYDHIKDLTFETFIYPIDHKLEKLPFEKCMVRYEHKSPKDSEYWTYCTSYDQIKKILDTSLTAINNPGKYLCIRKWYDDIKYEFRCFWNKQLVAVADHSSLKNQILKLNPHMQNKIIDYISSISHKIPYIRCIMDICIHNDNQIKIIEFNSWESNSGALPFDWIDDTDILYPNFRKSSISVHFRSADQLYNSYINTVNKSYDKYDDNANKHKIKTIFDEMIVINTSYPSSWLKTEKYIYVMSDIWLCVFNHDMTIYLWKRGVFRFSSIYEMSNGLIIINDKDNINHKLYNYDLSIYRGAYKFNEKDIKTKIDLICINNKFDIKYRYGFMCQSRYDQKLYFYRFNVDSEDYWFDVIKIEI